ncbi:hypothetical protein JR316_0007523 [Psilocybe cubensis]|uniref:Uncharacterized protein n=2 Tax=Psilocybe cubensis TaxID=181762 RepID=A0ACB8GZ61_PSICU|nr:hypothetical protein JR316_0007523 [Psilocybe cubensis]KAH9480921.1 hypothetical protein JR316_0007523 [Psilocybe cubensis]
MAPTDFYPSHISPALSSTTNPETHNGNVLTYNVNPDSMSPPTTPRKGSSSRSKLSATIWDTPQTSSTASGSRLMSNVDLPERPPSSNSTRNVPAGPIPGRMFAEIPGHSSRYAELGHGSPRSPRSPARHSSTTMPIRSPPSSPRSPGISRIPSISKLREKTQKAYAPYTRPRSSMGSSSVTASDDTKILRYETFKVPNKEKTIECGWPGCKSEFRNTHEALQSHLGRYHVSGNGGKCEWDNCEDDTKFLMAENLARHTAAMHVATYSRICPLCRESLTPQAVGSHVRTKHPDKVLYKC